MVSDNRRNVTKNINFSVNLLALTNPIVSHAIKAYLKYRDCFHTRASKFERVTLTSFVQNRHGNFSIGFETDRGLFVNWFGVSVSLVGDEGIKRGRGSIHVARWVTRGRWVVTAFGERRSSGAGPTIELKKLTTLGDRRENRAAQVERRGAGRKVDGRKWFRNLDGLWSAREKRNNPPCFFRELPLLAEMHFPLLGFALRVATASALLLVVLGISFRQTPRGNFLADVARISISSRLDSIFLPFQRG